MRFHRLVLASCVVSAAALNACGAEAPSESVGSQSAAVSIQKSYPRKIYVHVMPWFQVGGQHWSMNARNADSGVASWYAPMIGEYNFFSKPNHIKVNGTPALLVFGPQKFKNASDWSNILSVFSTKPQFFPLWYNDSAGANATGKFAWVAQNGLKGVSDFDSGLDGVDHGNKIPVIYPGFNPFYVAGGWGDRGPAWKVSYNLTQDNAEGGDTMTSSFELGKYAGEPLQIATWNDYGEGTMIEPSTQGKAGAGFGYRFLMSLQKSVGAVYTDAELKIVKMLYDQRKQFGASKQADLDTASAALANLDVAKACTILGCTAPVHTGAGGTTGAGGAPTGGSGAPGSAGSAPAHAGSTSIPGGGATAAGGSNSNPAGGTPTSGGQAASNGGASSTGNAGASEDDSNQGKSGFGACSLSAAGQNGRGQSALLFVVGAAALAGLRRRRRA